MKFANSIANTIQQRPAELVKTTWGRGSWKGVTLARIEFLSDYSIRRPAHDYYVVVYYSGSSPRRLLQKRAGKVHDGRIYPGMCIVAPRGCDGVYEGEATTLTSFYVPHELMVRAAEEVGRTRANYEIVIIFQIWDATIGNLANLFLSEMDRPVHPTQALITDTISHALAGHLLRSYNAFDIQEHPRVGLGPHALSRVIAYIEDHADASIWLDELANIAGVSRFHFSRLFKISTGKSPMAYVEQSRIRKAQQLIVSGRATLAEIALMGGFADQSHFTRRFQLYTGCSPGVFARNKGIRLSHVTA